MYQYIIYAQRQIVVLTWGRERDGELGVLSWYVRLLRKIFNVVSSKGQKVKRELDDQMLEVDTFRTDFAAGP